MKTAFIIHGTGGNPEGNWFPWMKERLEETGFRVFIPAFSTPEHQSLENWRKEFEPYKKHIDEETIFIAHSVGPSFVLSILEEIDVSMKACFFAAGFLGDIHIPEFDALNTTFVNRDFHWEIIKNNCAYFYMCHGSDDPYVPLFSAKIIADNLGVDIDIIEEGGHLNKESGYTSFEYLLEKIFGKFRSEKYEEILNNNIYLSLATVDEEYGTWISPVFFCRKKNNLYFSSQKSSKHIQNINKNSKVTFAIFDSHAPEGEGNGIQGIGEVIKVKKEDLSKALKIYITNFLSPSDFESDNYTLFKIKISKVFILDPFSGADIRVGIQIF